MSKNILQIRCGETPDILLLGNGINRAYGFASWDDLIQSIQTKELSKEEAASLKDVPYPLQPVILTGDHLDEQMKSISHQLSELKAPEAENTVLRDFASIDFDAILTTNYTYELEKALDSSFHCVPGRQCKLRRTAYTGEGKYNTEQLHTYFRVANAPSIWHVHGEAARYGTVILGHYYYGKLLAKMQKYVSYLIAKHRASISRGQDMEAQSWIDWFMLGNIHIVGLGMSLSEMDLWWLINCKKRNFPDTTVTLYKSDIRTEERLLAEAYGVIIKDDGYAGSYRAYYRDVCERLKAQISESLPALA